MTMETEQRGQRSDTTPKGRRLTEHARESLMRHGFREPFDVVDDIIDYAMRITTQTDGATVYIQRAGRRGRNYDIVVKGEDGIITSMLNLTRHKMNNLGRNYGFALSL
jgi:filamentous hemagglutinin